MKYSETTKKNCIALRHAFGDSTVGEPIEIRHKLWVEFVNNSDLSDEEKLACKTEFLNPADKWRYIKKR